MNTEEISDSKNKVNYDAIYKRTLSLKIKILLLIGTLTFSSGCVKNKDEQKHIEQYITNIKNLSTNLNSSHSITTIADLHLKLLYTINGLNTVKKHFLKYEKEEKLKSVITLYDSVLTHLYKQQIFIIMLGGDIWSKNDAKYEKIKDDKYFNKQQNQLFSLLSLIEQYKYSMLSHKEHIRQQLVYSPLSKEERKTLWPELNKIIHSHLNKIKPTLKLIKKKVYNEIEINKYLNKHKDEFVANKEKGIQFHFHDKRYEYERKLRELKWNRNAIGTTLEQLKTIILDKLGHQTRNYATQDFGRVKYTKAISFIVSKDIAKLTLSTVRNIIPFDAQAFIGTTRNLSKEQETGVEIVILATNDKFNILRASKSNGINFGISNETLIQKLMLWDKHYNIDIWQAETDTVQLKLTRLPENLDVFVKDLYKFCPDIVDQGSGNFNEIIDYLKNDHAIYLWWD